MSIQKLLSVASQPLAENPLFDTTSAPRWEQDERFQELMQMLTLRNGFYAFESALHVFPWTNLPAAEGCVGIQAWNERTLWRDWYGQLTEGLYFFAEDAFGGQFAIRAHEIVSFDPESGDTTPVALSFADWATALLTNYAQLTGFPTAHEWQVLNGPIPNGKRLLPKTPFILGGRYHESNLCAVDAVKGMRYRGELWQQIRDLPDGAQVRLKTLPLQ